MKREPRTENREPILQRAHSVMRRITGMPDYNAYLTHLREHHPGAATPTEREFFDDYLKRRYESGPTRCC